MALEEEQAVIRGVLQESQDRGLRADQIERDLEAALSEIKLYKVENTDLLRQAWLPPACNFALDLEILTQL